MTAPASPHSDEQVAAFDNAFWKVRREDYVEAVRAGIAAVRPLIEAAHGQHIHDRIIAELVCCHTYNDGDPDKAEKAGHAICYWGEAAARIALNPDQET